MQTPPAIVIPERPALALPTTRAKLILLDPNWRYDVRGTAGSGNGVAENHYRTSVAGSIAALPIPEMADPRGCAMAMWATMPMLEKAFALIRYWGFSYKTALFVWIKLGANGKPIANGLGNWTRSTPRSVYWRRRGA